jgi:glycosyltransferase involved in cell wall biosynthesis
MIGRVLWITERYPPSGGGMAVSCARQVYGLRRRGVSLDVVTFSAGGPESIVTQRDGGLDLCIRRDPVHGLAPNIAWSTVRERHAQAQYSWCVGFGASWSGYLATTFAAWLDVPAAVLVRGNDLDRDWFLPRRGGWVREALSRAAVVGAVSLEKVERIRRLYPGRCVIWTPNGIDIERWKLLPADQRRRSEVRGLLNAEGRRVLGLFGDLKAKKRIPFFLEALRDRRLLPRLALLVVGNLDEETARLLDDPALAPRSLRLPFCAPSELAGLYSACDYTAIPSGFEGMPNVLLEAMACGVVPIVSDAGALGEVIREGETGFIFPAGDRDAAGAAVERALTLPEADLQSMSERVRANVAERFTAAREIDVLVGMLSRSA